MLDKNVMAGIKVSDNKILVAVTETNTNEDIEEYFKALKDILGE